MIALDTYLGIYAGTQIKKSFKRSLLSELNLFGVKRAGSMLT